MKRVVNGDQAALAELYDLYADLVYGMALRVLNNQALAEEATQDTFLKLWHQASRWDAERGKLSNWILSIARYTAIDRLRKEKRQDPLDTVEITDLLERVGRPASFGGRRWTDKQLLSELIQQLTPEQIEVLNLAYFGGLSQTEMAEKLDKPLGTVKSRVRSALQKLRGLWLAATEDA